MRIPFTLHPLSAALPTAGILAPSHRADEVLHVVLELALDPLPSLHRVAEGVLVILPRELDRVVPGVFRLRRLATHLWLPVDAELIPPLLEEEAAGLVSKRGLVFLPGLRVLEYDKDQPLPLEALVQAPPPRRDGWQAFPEPPSLPPRVDDISLEPPFLVAEEILEPGGEGIGEEAPRPKDAGMGAKMLGGTLMGLGKGLAWLGKGLHLSALAGLGAKLMAGAMKLAPRLSEKLMGEQEAALRNLLRDFREGKIDQALRRALPLGNDTARGAVPHQGSELPRHSLFFSLVNLLGSRGSGAGGVWFTRDDVYAELLREYRKQAELAAQNGDYRRAAFIFGKLLNDFRAAAAVLSRGGLHREAAIIHWKKLNDLRAAAREFESAGEVDRAVQLYRQVLDHVAAGDLLRRAGEEERAVAEFQQAAAHMVQSGKGHYQAGELMRDKVPQHPALAVEHYRQGWQDRPRESPVPCAVRLVQHHAQQKEPRELLTVLGEAEEFLREPGHEEPASSFFNEIARLAATPELAAHADDLRDRALLGLAGKMRQYPFRAGAGAADVTMFFPSSALWPVPLVNDARHAAAEQPRTPEKRIQPRTLQLRQGMVTAAAMDSTGALLVGFADGAVIRFLPATGEMNGLHRERGPVICFCLLGDGNGLVVTHRLSAEKVRLSVLHKDIGFRLRHYADLPAGPAAFTSVNTMIEDETLALWDGHAWVFLRLPELTPIFSNPLTSAAESSEEEGAAPLAAFFAMDERPALLALDQGELKLYGMPTRSALSFTLLGATGLGRNEMSSLEAPAVAWREVGPRRVELSGVSEAGEALTLHVDLQARQAKVITYAASPKNPHRAVTWLGPNRLAVVTDKEVRWFAAPAKSPRTSTDISLSQSVACFHYRPTDELLVLGAEGTLLRIPVPR